MCNFCGIFAAELILFVMRNTSSAWLLSLISIFIMACTPSAVGNTPKKDQQSIILDESKVDITYGAVKSVKSVCYYAHKEDSKIVKDRVMPNYAVFMEPQTLREFDNDGQLVAITYYDAFSRVTRTVKNAYAEGELISSAYFDRNGDLEWKDTYTYENEQLVSFNKKEQYDSPNAQSIYEINDNVITGVSHYYNDQLTSYEEYSYENGNLVQTVKYDESGRVTLRSAAKWTEKNQYLSFTSDMFFSNGRVLHNISEYTYNEDFLITRYEEKTDNNGIAFVFEYLSFDKQGNWLSRYIQIEGSEGCLLEERTIEYYK